MPAEIRDALILLPLALHLILCLGAAGIPLVAVVSQMLARTRRKTFLDRFGRQIVPLSLGLWIWAAATTGVVWLTMAGQQATAAAFFTAQPWMPLLGGAAGATFVVLLAYFLSWKALKERKPLHIAIGLTAAVLSLATIALVAGVKRLVLVPDAPGQSILGLLPPFEPTSFFWPIVILALILAMASAGSLSQLWLLVRRNRDDFGRDYYNYNLRSAASWAAYPSLASLLQQGWLAYLLYLAFGDRLLTGLVPILWGASAGLLLLAAILWLVVARGENPLRRKGEIIVGFILLLVSLTGLVLALMYLFGLQLPI